MDAPDGTGLAIDVREFMLDEFWRRIREAQARAALTGRKISGPDAGAAVHGAAAEGLVAAAARGRELAEPMALAVVKAEAIAAEAG
jgi:hypothetical protein